MASPYKVFRLVTKCDKLGIVIVLSLFYDIDCFKVIGPNQFKNRSIGPVADNGPNCELTESLTAEQQRC